MCVRVTRAIRSLGRDTNPILLPHMKAVPLPAFLAASLAGRDAPVGAKGRVCGKSFKFGKADAVSVGQPHSWLRRLCRNSWFLARGGWAPQHGPTLRSTGPWSERGRFACVMRGSLEEQSISVSQRGGCLWSSRACARSPARSPSHRCCSSAALPLRENHPPVSFRGPAGSC